MDDAHEHAATDAEAVALSLDRPAAFGALYERHARAVHAFLARRGGVQAADDLLGEVFTTAFDARRRYDVQVGDARPWLYGISRNLLRANGRREQRAQAVAARVVETHPLDGWPEVDERLDAAGPGGVARAVLASLPDGEREVLELVAWEGLGPAEVARVLGIPAGTARARLHRARTTLRAALAAHEASGERPRRNTPEATDVQS